VEPDDQRWILYVRYIQIEFEIARVPTGVGDVFVAPDRR
jgi:hypothetical protein